MRPNEFQHLVLLVGTNPLPNYVTADYFLQTQGKNIRKIWLIYSIENDLQGGTLRYVDNLEKIMIKKWNGDHTALEFPLEKIGLSDVSHARAIQSEIRESRLAKGRKNEHFHLNYTGGTKSMSTHAYWILREFSRGRNKEEKKVGDISFSYLDARNFRLIDDDEDQIIEKDLRKKVSLTCENLLGLHGYQIIDVKNTEQIEIKNTEQIEKARQIFKEYVDPHITKERKKKIKECEKGGKWLEAYVADKLQSMSKENEEYIEIKNNLEMRYPQWVGRRSNFEIDVMLVHGYQLTGISCTVQETPMQCKQKGFEIILRTRQIGGDESKAILITGANRYQTQILQQELILDTGGNRENIKVFGIEDLRREEYFLKEIKRFIFKE